MQKVWIAYIAGPMAGQPDHGYPVFQAAKEQLTAEGFMVFSPHDGGPNEHQIALQTHGRYPSPARPFHHTPLYQAMLRRDFGLIMQADKVFLLEGWEHSNGAKIEAMLAQSIGIPLIRYADRADVVIEGMALNIMPPLPKRVVGL